MQLFYFNQRNSKGNVLLTDDELGHCTRTLRKQIGDNVHLIDGLGGLYEGKILNISKREAEIEILEQQYAAAPRPLKLHLAVAPTKNIERIEWLLEKAIEIGLETFTPLLCARSERKQIRTDRLEKIALSAAKQSLNICLPKINEITDFEAFITASASIEHKFIAHCYDGMPREFLPLTLAQISTQKSNNQDVIILIGPEGDFTTKEVELAAAGGLKPTVLGNTRLRTETAGLVATTMLAHANYLIAPEG